MHKILLFYECDKFSQYDIVGNENVYGQGNRTVGLTLI